jgi:hypothetical protein
MAHGSDLFLQEDHEVKGDAHFPENVLKIQQAAKLPVY